ncbi:hypothetical protein QFC21_005686 [Naganishia friedmannii]|uniref:Uncharacterized protein n=1 Tax=Naganishia friedmannii TaxID=89922 RepID=A0ACC2V7I2_9TREE|nr:hypothetical protein QFC21_005686 [Naganishia friedmannii]
MLTEIHDYKIRTARDHDFEIIAEILYRHYQSYNWWNIVNSQVVETSWLRTTMDALRDDSREGDGGASFIIEEAGVVAGVVSYVELKKRFDPLPESDRMPGANNSEAEKIDNSSFKEEMVTRYKEVLWLSKLAVHMGYLGKGAAKFGMRFVIDEAKKKELNVAIAAVPGK